MDFDLRYNENEYIENKSVGQMQRHIPRSEIAAHSSGSNTEFGFHNGDDFEYCGQTECIKLSGISVPGAEMSFDYSRYPRPSNGNNNSGSKHSGGGGIGNWTLLILILSGMLRRRKASAGSA